MPGQRFIGQSASAAPEPAPTGPQSPAAGPSAPITPQRYRSNAPVIGGLIAVIVVALAVTLVWAGTRLQQGTSTPTTTPTQTTPSAPSYTPSPNWQGIEFTYSGYDASGYWQAGPAVWDDDIVTIPMTLSVDTGIMRFSFFVLDNQQANNDYESIGGTMEVGSVSAGQSQTGTVMFQMPRGDFTLYLATAYGYQVTALLISG